MKPWKRVLSICCAFILIMTFLAPAMTVSARDKEDRPPFPVVSKNWYECDKSYTINAGETFSEKINLTWHTPSKGYEILDARIYAVEQLQSDGTCVQVPVESSCSQDFGHHEYARVNVRITEPGYYRVLVECYVRHSAVNQYGNPDRNCVLSEGWGQGNYFYLDVLEVPVSSVSLPEELHMFSYTDEKLTAQILPTNATYQEVKWRSLDTSIVYVDPTGTVTGLKHGRTYVCADSVQYPALTDKCLVYVHTQEHHEGKKPTCTEAGWEAYDACAECDYRSSYKEIPALGHTAVSAPGLDPTCTEAGMSGQVICEVCGIVLQEGDSIPPTGHQEQVVAGSAATCTEPGLTDGLVCAVCGEILQAHEPIAPYGHRWDGGTVTAAGTLWTCTICKETKIDDNPPLPDVERQEELEIWISAEHQGIACDSVIAGEKYYYSFLMTEGIASEMTSAVRLTLLNPDGSVFFTIDMNSKKGSLGIIIHEPGTYKLTAEAIGAYDILRELTFEVVESSSEPLKLQASEDSLSISQDGGDTREIYLWTTGSYNGDVTITWTCNNENVICREGTLNAGKLPLIITAQFPGESVITVTLKDRETDAILDSMQIFVTVLAPQIREYTVSYDPNGGVNAPASQQVPSGQYLSVSKTIPVRDGYRFLGWAKTKNATVAQYQPGDQIQITSEFTLYAVWEVREGTEIATGWSGATQWTLTDDGVLTVYGNGNMKNYGYDGNQPWISYADKITSIVIEDGVTAVGEGAFMGLMKLESVTLPDTGLTKIGEAAFYGCSSLKEIDIPDSVYTVFDYTFKNCTSLESVRLSKILIKIGQGAFENCSSLGYIYIPGDTEIIGSWSFKGCTGLVEADMQWADATKIREGAFKNCSSLTNIILPAGIQTLGDSCFYGIAANSFTVPQTVTSVEAWCFARAYALDEIIFKGDAPTIGEGAFNKISLTVYYPKGNASWTPDKMQTYGGTVDWKAK